ncbi:hypothetical protein V6N11_011522 [Hibiscus sabdariffa]|uniref:Uncharacterized protein n=1 Tax=Hibiscus sabdariffa TaxID=183260 RepID=A0ABR2S8G6_9ROSI
MYRLRKMTIDKSKEIDKFLLLSYPELLSIMGARMFYDKRFAIAFSQQPYKLDGVCGVLLDTEARLQETHSANLDQNSNLGYDGYQFSSSGGPNVFVDQAYYPFVGQVSSGAPISQKAFSDSDKSTFSSLLESFRFPKLSLISKTVDSEQDRAGYSSTSQVPPPLSSEFKFPAKLLVYQRRPKVLLPNQQAELSSMSTQHQQAESLSCQHSESLSQQQAGYSSLFNQQQTESSFLPIQQAEFCFHQDSSTGFSQTSNSPDDVPQSSATSLFGSGSQVSNLLDDSSDKLAKTQECSARESSNSQERNLGVSPTTK